MSTPSGDFTQRQSGILVPTATLDKTQRTLLDKDFSKLWRLMKMAHENGLLVSYHCAKCKGVARRYSRNRLVDAVDGQPIGGALSLSCECTTWTVR